MFASPSYRDVLAGKATPAAKPVRSFRAVTSGPVSTAMPGNRTASPGHTGSARGIITPVAPTGTALQGKPPVDIPVVGSVLGGARLGGPKSATPQGSATKMAATGATKNSRNFKSQKNGEGEVKREEGRHLSLSAVDPEEDGYEGYLRANAARLAKAGVTGEEYEKHELWLKKESKERERRAKERRAAKLRAEELAAPKPIRAKVQIEGKAPDLFTANYLHDRVAKRLGSARGSVTPALIVPVSEVKASPTIVFNRTEEKLMAARANARANIAKSDALLKSLPKARPKAHLRNGDKPAVAPGKAFVDRKLEAMRAKAKVESRARGHDLSVAASGVQKRAPLPMPVATRSAPAPAVSGYPLVHTTMPARASGEDRTRVAGIKKAVVASAPAASSGRGSVPPTSRPTSSALAPRASRVQKPLSTTTAALIKPKAALVAASALVFASDSRSSSTSTTSTTFTSTIPAITTTLTPISKGPISLKEYCARLAARNRGREEDEERFEAKKARVFGNVDGNVKRLAGSATAPPAAPGAKILKRGRDDFEEERGAKRARSERK